MSENTATPFFGKKILYVDDSKLFLSVIGGLIEVTGAEFLGVDHPQKVAEEVKNFCPDLIITDYEMPGINGVELIQLLRSKEDFAGIPIVLLTASDDPQICLKGIQAGADDFIAKSELSKILVPKILALLRIRQNNLTLITLKEKQTVHTMIATYKHEFNNALMMFEGRLTKLTKMQLSEDQSEVVQKIREILERMKGILKDLDKIREVETENYSGDTKILKIR